MQPDYSKLDPELQKKIEEWQKNSPSYKQLQTLEDLTAITQEIFGILEDNTTDTAKTAKELGATLLDIRDKLTSLNDKEMPEMPDHAKPVVGAIDELKKALTTSIKGIELRPDIKVASPDVKIPEVDLSALEKVVKTELPKAFKEAIKLIPETKIPENDYSELADLLRSQIDWLESIDIASRMKPTFPVSQLNTLVTKQDDIIAAIGTISGVTSLPNDVILRYKSTDTNIIYVGEAANGSATSGALWKITRLDTTTLLDVTYADGNLTADNVWDNRESLSYS